jgi:hypothetical protein
MTSLAPRAFAGDHALLIFLHLRHVDRQQEILAADFDAVAGIEQEGRVAAADLVGEFDYFLVHQPPHGIFDVDDVESDLGQRIADRA